jgi:Raf kinase inhibitor-like YbhB/YbcL family protein
MNRRSSFITLSLVAGTALSFSLLTSEARSQTQDNPKDNPSDQDKDDQKKPSDEKSGDQKSGDKKSGDQMKPGDQNKPSDQKKPSDQTAPGPMPAAPGQTINVTSSEFTSGGAIPQKNTCEGGGKPPALEWSGLPANTKSVAIVVDDPDAPQGTYVHWIVYNIPPTQMTMAEGAAVPNNAKQGKNGKGQTGYTAPCPPSGTHHYRFKVYALSDMLTVDKPTSDELNAAMKGKMLGQGELMGTYTHGAGGAGGGKK